MMPSECMMQTRHIDITRARIIVFFFWCLPIKDINLSAPGIADFSSLYKLFLAFFSFPVCPSSIAADSLPTDIIEFESSSVLFIPWDSSAKFFSLLLLREDLLPPPLESPKQFCHALNCFLISFCKQNHVSQLKVRKSIYSYSSFPCDSYLNLIILMCQFGQLVFESYLYWSFALLQERNLTRFFQYLFQLYEVCVNFLLLITYLIDLELNFVGQLVVAWNYLLLTICWDFRSWFYVAWRVLQVVCFLLLCN